MGRLDGQVAIVTGGASGLGQGIVERFVTEGARVGVLDRSKEGCAALVEQLGDRVSCVAGDVREYEANEKVVNQTVADFGRLDCVIGNAGIWDYNLTLVNLPE